MAANRRIPDGPENHGVRVVGTPTCGGHRSEYRYPDDCLATSTPSYCNRTATGMIRAFAMDILLCVHPHKSRRINRKMDEMERVGRVCQRQLAASSEIGNRVGGVKPSRGLESLPLRFLLGLHEIPTGGTKRDGPGPRANFTQRRHMVKFARTSYEGMLSTGKGPRLIPRPSRSRSLQPCFRRSRWPLSCGRSAR